MNRYQKISDAAKASAVPEELEVVRASEIKMEAIDWAWPGRFALGKLGLLGGNPERGKGLILADMCSSSGRDSSVHDCFACLAPHARRFNEIIREQFVRLHTQHDLLGQVREFARRNLPRGTALPVSPAKGTLDLKPSYWAFA
jgi:hypothetical protein